MSELTNGERSTLEHLLRELRYANRVLEEKRFAGLDQNPKGIRDIYGSVEIQLRNIIKGVKP